MEFNTGKPPAGEAGMCVLLTRESARREYFRRWDGKTFYCGRYCDHPDSARLAFREPIAIGLNVVDWRWATIAEITAAGIPESEARGMVHKSQLPYVIEWPAEPRRSGPTHIERKVARAQQALAADERWGPWIVGYSDACPIPSLKAGDYEIRMSDGFISRPVCDAARHGSWAPLCLDILNSGKAPLRINAYRVREPFVSQSVRAVAACATGAADPGWRDWKEGDAIPAVDRIDIIRIAAGIKGASLSQVDNVATASQYWGPNSFVRKWRPAVVAPQIADPNAKMIDRDGSAQPRRWWSDVAGAASYAAGFYDWFTKHQRDSTVSANAFTERGFDHRCGLWPKD